MTRTEKFFVWTDRFEPSVLLVGLAVVTAAFWLGFILGAVALVRACA